MRFFSSRGFFPISALLLCLVFLSGCKFLIPEDPNAPRYNTVLGTKHRPEGNTGAAANPGPQSSYHAPSAPAQPSLAPAFSQSPPPYTSASSPYAATTGVPQEEKGFWGRLFSSDERGNTAPATSYERRMPEENIQLAHAANASATVMNGSGAALPPAGYPQLQSVPPRPVSDADRLNAVRAQLEQERAMAMQSSAHLSAAAAAEPSLLAPMPEPIAVNNLPPPPNPMAPIPAPPNYQLPPASSVPQAAPAPITLTPPTPQPAATPYVQYGASPVTAMPPSNPGGFNPMAQPYPAPQGMGYLPESRYMQRRTQ